METCEGACVSMSARDLVCVDLPREVLAPDVTLPRVAAELVRARLERFLEAICRTSLAFVGHT